MIAETRVAVDVGAVWEIMSMCECCKGPPMRRARPAGVLQWTV